MRRILTIAFLLIAVGLFFMNREVSVTHFDTSTLKRSYQLEYNTTVQMGSNRNLFVFKSQIDMYAFSHLDETIVALSFSKIEINQQELHALYSKLLKEIIFIKILPTGEIKEFSFYYNRDNYRNIKQIFYTLETILTGDKSYTITQQDSNGKVEVDYNRDKNSIIKKKIKYSDSSSIKIVRSDFITKIDSTWITNLKGVERYRVSLNDTVIENQLNFNKIEDNDVELFTLSTTELLDIFKSYNNRKKINLVKDFQEQSSIAKMKNIALDVEQSSRNVSYQIKANGKVQDIKGIIKNSKDEKLRLKLIEALRQSSTPQAQDALMEITMDSEFIKGDRLDALASLGFIDMPKEDLVDFLMETYYNEDKGLSSTAILAIGNLYHSIENRDRQNEIISNIKDEYANKGTNGIPLLRAMQNIGASKFKEEIYQSIKSNNFFEQYNALNIVADIDSEETKQELLNILDSDVNRELKESAKKALKSLSSYKSEEKNL